VWKLLWLRGKKIAGGKLKREGDDGSFLNASVGLFPRVLHFKKERNETLLHHKTGQHKLHVLAKLCHSTVFTAKLCHSTVFAAHASASQQAR
jgi:hypothetical protein